MRMSRAAAPAAARTGVPAARLTPAAPAAPATAAKELVIAPTEDGGALITSDQDGAALSFAPTEDGSGLTISETLADGTPGESVTVQPAPAMGDAKPADAAEGQPVAAE